MVRAAAKNHDSRDRDRRSGRLRAVLAELSAQRRRHQHATRARARGQGVRPHGAVRRAWCPNYLRAARGRSADDLPGHAAAGSTRCRTCATARTRTSRPRSTASRAPAARASRRRHQLQGKELSYNNIADADTALECVRAVRRARLRDRQARQSLRRRAPAASLRRGLRPRLSHRSDLGLRRHHRLQPRARRATRRSAIVERQFVEVIVAPSCRAAARGRARGQGQCARAGASAPLGRSSRAELEYRSVVGGLLVQTRDTALVAARRASRS